MNALAQTAIYHVTEEKHRSHNSAAVYSSSVGQVSQRRLQLPQPLPETTGKTVWRDIESFASCLRVLFSRRTNTLP
ncbi:unnamed protein product [Coregonus sp. 'balchen']|nr:unnamed protein product [Coregonus sp. 'balchen']